MYDKYIKSLELLDQIIQHTDISIIHENTDNLFTFIYKNFEEPKSSTEEHYVPPTLLERIEFDDEFRVCRNYLKSDRTIDEYKEIIHLIPPVIIDSVWPVMILLIIFRETRKVDFTKLKTFKEFHRRHGGMVLNTLL